MSDFGVNNSGPKFDLNLTKKEAGALVEGGIGKGRKTDRLGISEDKTIQIAAKSLTSTKLSIFQRHKYVELTGSKMLLNIRSAAKRLGITPKAVESMAKEGAEGLKKAVATREAVLKKYEDLAKKSGWGLSGGNKTLLKICEASIDRKTNKFEAAKISVRTAPLTKHTVYVERDLKVFSFLEKKLGGGGYGKVYQVKTYKTKGHRVEEKTQALKESAAKDNDAESLRNEAKMILKLNEETKNPLPPVGIPRNYKEVHVITGKNQQTIGFARAELMDGDLYSQGQFLSKFQELPAGTRLDLCFQLVQGLAHTHNTGIIHGDIKPQNCLMQNADTGEPARFILSDFGGALKKEELKNKEVLVAQITGPMK